MKEQGLAARLKALGGSKMETHEPTTTTKVESSSELTARQIINLLKDCDLDYEQAREIEDWLYPLYRWENK